MNKKTKKTKKTKTMFFEFKQNNTGGHFDVDKKLCNRVVIEAPSLEVAQTKGLVLGMYWDGVNSGTDCACCGDRWYAHADIIDLKSINKEGFKVWIYRDSKEEWFAKFGKYLRIGQLCYLSKFEEQKYEGRIKFRNIVEYLQFMANEYGWTSPDVRIYYSNGKVKEIFSKRVV